MKPTQEKLTRNAGLVRFGRLARELGVPDDLRPRSHRLEWGPPFFVCPMEAHMHSLLDAHVGSAIARSRRVAVKSRDSRARLS